MTAKDWVSSDQPISYEFGQMMDAAGQQVPLAFTAEPLIAVSTYTVDELPIGDPSTNYTMLLYVEVTTPYGAKTQEMILCQSRPPKDPAAAIEKKLATARSSGDPAEAVNAIMTALTLQAAPTPAPGEAPDPEVLASLEEMLTVMDQATADKPMSG